MRRGVGVLAALPAAAAATRGFSALYQIKGPYGVMLGEPLHENLAMLSLRDALQSAGWGRGTFLAAFDAAAQAQLPAWNREKLLRPEDAPLGVQELLRGVTWPDDPGGFLFDDPTGTTDYASGASWAAEFKKNPGKQENLVARAHHGDLSFMHAMATADGEQAVYTQDNILKWGVFLVRVARGEVLPQTTLRATTVAGFFPAQGDWTVARLLLGEKHHSDGALPDVAVRQRAAGALLHLLQDSHSASHVNRDAAGAVVQFHAYGSQDSGKHGVADKPQDGGTLRGIVDATGGAAAAVNVGREAILMIDAGTDPALFIASAFRLARGALPAGPGDYKKSEKDDDDLESWVIGVIVAVWVLCCLLCIVFLYLCSRGDKAKKGDKGEQGAGEGEAEKAAVGRGAAQDEAGPNNASRAATEPQNPIDQFPPRHESQAHSRSYAAPARGTEEARSRGAAGSAAAPYHDGGAGYAAGPAKGYEAGTSSQRHVDVYMGSDPSPEQGSRGPPSAAARGGDSARYS